MASSAEGARGAKLAQEKEQLLRREIGNLREELAEKEKLVENLGVIAAGRDAEGRLTSSRTRALESELESARREMQSMQSRLDRASTSGGSLLVSEQAYKDVLEDNTRLRALLRDAAAETTRLGNQLLEEKERAERIWGELQERERTVQSLQRQLAAAGIDRVPTPMAPGQFPTSGLASQYAGSSLQGSSLHVGAPAFKPLSYPPFQIPSVPGRQVPTPQAPSAGVVGARPPQLGGAPQAMLPPRAVGVMPPPANTAPIQAGRPQPPQQQQQQLAPQRAPPAGPWRCEHCTFENRNPPIFDQLTQAYKGFCEICQGVTTVRGR